MVFVKLAVDFENPARAWWDGGGRQLWEAIAESADAPHMIVDETLAKSWLVQAAALPGWDDGPEYAPHPIALQDVDPDEEF